MHYQTFDKSWESWIKTNIDRKCCKKGMFKKLLEHGFSYDEIKKRLNIEYDFKENYKYEFDNSWEQWIDTNINRNCDKKGIFKILLDNHFDYNLIKNKLNIDYTAQNNISNFYNIKLKNAIKYNTDKADIYTLEKFLTDEECNKIMEISDTKLIPSKISTSDSEPDKYFRTNLTCQLSTITNIEHRNFIQSINEKICDYMGIKDSYSEGIQAQKYTVGQEFKVHTDFFTPGTKEFKNHCTRQGNRTWSLMIYLNNTEVGGETEFPRISAKFFPKKGMAIIWNNLYENGCGNHNTLHAGKPIIKGTKYIITKWFRQIPL